MVVDFDGDPELVKSAVASWAQDQRFKEILNGVSIGEIHAALLGPEVTP